MNSLVGKPIIGQYWAQGTINRESPCGNVTVALRIHTLIGPQMGSDITSVTDRQTHARYSDKVLIITWRPYCSYLSSMQAMVSMVHSTLLMPTTNADWGMSWWKWGVGMWKPLQRSKTSTSLVSTLWSPTLSEYHHLYGFLNTLVSIPSVDDYYG